MLTALEICAGAGGQALGLERAGFRHAAVVEIDKDACATLRLNRGPGCSQQWEIHETDVRDFDAAAYRGVDLVAGGVPCPPFSIAGKRLGAADERDLFPEALRIVAETDPSAVMLENVRGLSTQRFASYREQIICQLESLGYFANWQLLNAAGYGVPQLRPRFILVALKRAIADEFHWPPAEGTPPTVGQTLYPFMARDGWRGAQRWIMRANGIGPTLVGGSKKHGGPDLGPTRAKAAWKALGVDGMGIADGPPGPRFPIDGCPKLTVEMAAALQGFPPDWKISGRKTAAYRQVGNAFPPPVAEAVGRSIMAALSGREQLVDLSDMLNIVR